MSLLMKIRLKSMFGSMKKSMGSKKAGMGALVVFLVIICVISIESLMFGAWYLLAPLLETDFSWLYFALAGILAFAFGIFGTVFTTQSQMYQAKDNELLLAMPIKPLHIISSRILVLYLLTFVFTAVVMVPAGIVYATRYGFSLKFAVLYLLAMVLLSMVTQTITCLLGWLLHFLLAGFKHKAIVATFFLTIVMIAYLVVMNRLDDVLLTLVENGGKIAGALQSFAWPFYAMGLGCMGDVIQFLLFAVFSLGIFAVVIFVLSKTFVKAMLAGGRTKGATKQKRDEKVRTAAATICKKESKRFFTSTTYLVNIGMGLFMVVAFVIAGIMFKDSIVQTLGMMKNGGKMYAIIIVGAMGLLAAMTPISAPSVSLEGKHIWVLRSMPVPGSVVLNAKLRFHCIVTVPLAFVGSAVLGFVYGCSVVETLLAAVCASLLFVLCGSLGIIFNMCFPKLDWPSEAAPCKQSIAIFFVMFVMLFVSGGVAVLWFVGNKLLGVEYSTVVLLLLAVLLVVLNYLFWLLMTKWGGKKFETL